MAHITLTTRIDAPPERVFDLARSVDLHTRSMAGTGERAVAGVTSGLLEHGDNVTWRARHVGVLLELEIEINEFSRPNHFRDMQVHGPFSRMKHDHYFEVAEGGTMMRDEFVFRSPFGVVGRFADRLVLKRYLEKMLRRRNDEIRRVAESGEWRRYIP